jgi:integrase
MSERTAPIDFAGTARRKRWPGAGGSFPIWVFCNEGRAIWKSNFERRVFHKALEKAKLRRIRFHDLRHTFASRVIQNGELLVYVKDLGHHSIKVTVDVYGHLVPGANKAAVDRLDEQAQSARGGDRTRRDGAGSGGRAGDRAQPDATPAQPAGH